MKLTCLIKVNIILLEQGISGPSHGVLCQESQGGNPHHPSPVPVQGPDGSPKTACS